MIENTVTHSTTVPIDSDGLHRRVKMKQSTSGNILEVHTTFRDAPLNFPEGTTGEFRAYKPDGTFVDRTENINVSGDTITVEITSNTLAFAGNVICDLIMLHKGKTLGVANFTINVLPGAIPNDAVESHTDWQNLPEAIEAARLAAEEAKAYRDEVVTINTHPFTLDAATGEVLQWNPITEAYDIHTGHFLQRGETGERGPDGVWVGTEPPEDADCHVWVKTDGLPSKLPTEPNATVEFSSGTFTILSDRMPRGDVYQLTFVPTTAHTGVESIVIDGIAVQSILDVSGKSAGNLWSANSVPTIAFDKKTATVHLLYKGSGGGSSNALWLPEVDAQGLISWTRAESETTPLPRNIMGPQGPPGAAAPAMRAVRCRFAQQSVEARVEKTLAFNPDTIAGDAEMISVADGVFTAPKDGIYAYSSSSMRCSALAQVNVAIYTDTAGYTSARVAYARTEASSWGIASLSWTGFLAQGQFLRPVMWASVAQESIYEDNPGKNALAWVTFALLS